MKKGRKKRNKTTDKRINIRESPFTAVIFIMPFVLFLSVMAMNKGGVFEAFHWGINHPREAFFNYLLAFAITNVFLFLSRGKVYLALSFALTFLFSGLAYISRVKTELRGEPFTIGDFQLTGEAVKILEAFDTSYYTPLLLIGIVLIVVYLFVLIFTNIKGDNAVGFVFAGISIVVLIFGHFATIEKIAAMKIDVPADVSWNHQENGFLLASLIDAKFLDIPEPKHYNKESIEAIYKKMTDYEKEGEKEENPNVIYILNESFWDLSQFTDLAFNKEPIPFFKALANQTVSGNITVPVIGGGTVNTEFEVLTGFSKQFIKDFHVPYNAYSTHITKTVPSLAHSFSELGYDTTGIHTYHGWFYRRNDVYKHLGFDKLTALESWPNRPEFIGEFASDEEIKNAIMHELKRSPNRNFISAMTVEGHGAYDEARILQPTITLKSRLTPETRNIIENYANVIHDVDNQLKELVEELKAFDEPTVLVVYGDHIPPFGKQVYEEIGFDTRSDSGKEVPFLVWSNTQEFEPQTLDMDANFLSAYVLDLMGIKNNPYLNHLYSYYKETSHVDPKKNEDLYHDFELLQYDIIHGEHYLYEFMGVPEENPDYVLGEPLTLEEVSLIEMENETLLAATGDGISWMTTLWINDLEIEPFYTNNEGFIARVDKNTVEENDELTMVLKVKDSRGQIIKESNMVTVRDRNELLRDNHSLPNHGWNVIDLDENKEWEFFETRNNLDIVRLKVDSKEKVYFVDQDGVVLLDKSADSMQESNVSDLYQNGYLYLSISRADSGWTDRPTLEEINAYFGKNDYSLTILK